MSQETFPFRVLVIGAGLGGLCLAQGLRQAGVDVAVYERDEGLVVRKRAIASILTHAASRRCASAYSLACTTCSWPPAASQVAVLPCFASLRVSSRKEAPGRSPRAVTMSSSPSGLPWIV